MNRQLTCFVEKAWFEPKTLDIKAERYEHCSTRRALSRRPFNLQWMCAPGYIRHKTASGGRTVLYVLHTPDSVMSTTLSHVYYPWQVFQRWRLQSPGQEGPLHQGIATPRFPQHQVFPRQAATVSQARFRGCVGCMDGCCYYHFKTSKPGCK